MKIDPLRVVVKALVLYVIANVLFAMYNPSMGTLSVYNWLLPGRARFPYERAENVDKGYNISLFQDLDAAFASHVISNGEKQADEYRVILVGDSSIWGYAANSSDTLSARLNDLNLTSCDGRRMRFYNLGYPWSFIFKDLLVLEKSTEYDPDMVLWLFTMRGLTGSDKDVVDFFEGELINDAKRLQAEYQLRDYTSELTIQTFFEKTIVGERKKLKADITLQMYGFLWAATGIDHHLQTWLPWKDNLENSIEYRHYRTPEDWPRLQQDFMLDVIHAGHRMMGDAQVVIVNEPIYIASGPNSEIRYNKLYPRWAYDNYREFMSGWMSENQYLYVDMWQAIPQDEFSDFPVHLYPTGEQLLAEALSPEILGYSCE
jgi:hypothetical protein